ncbi:50S ribosomal protein L35 [Candidatus Peregrinibacteria bacterium]|nr:50S ribosomal protein L35 [Candidatus Peregrinibacteria bacterium]
MGKIGKVGKQKNRSAAKKRLVKTGSGKWRMQKSSRNHLLLQKSKRQKKLAEKPIILSPGEAKRATRLLPHY